MAEEFLGSTSNNTAVAPNTPLTWAAAHGAADARVWFPANTTPINVVYPLASRNSTSGFQIARCWLFFDSSSLPVNAAITAAHLDLYCYAFSGQASAIDPNRNDLCVVEGVQGDPIETHPGGCSWPNCRTNEFGDHVGKTTIGGLLKHKDMVASQYNNVDLDSTGIGWINKDGTTLFCLRTRVDIDDVQIPVGGEVNKFEFYARQYGDPRAPKLVVTYLLLPIVGTAACTGTIAEKSTGQGIITDRGGFPITQHGHCWSTSDPPTTSDSKTENGPKPNLGQFSSDITELIPGTLYYVRAYATNSSGTGYGVSVQITTASTIGPRYWWVEAQAFHFFGEDGLERKIDGVGVAGDSELLTHLIG